MRTRRGSGSGLGQEQGEDHASRFQPVVMELEARWKLGGPGACVYGTLGGASALGRHFAMGTCMARPSCTQT